MTAAPRSRAPRRRRVVILGAAGRDFHNFNVMYRADPATEVVAFTAAQIPDIAGRSYPPELAGPLYPDGIRIVGEDELAALIEEREVETVVLSYSDLSHLDVMHKASLSLAGGASFLLAGPRDTMLRSTKPVLSVCAVRTGAGKSPIARFAARHFKERGKRVAIIRHPMPYGDLARQAVQRFAALDDLDAARCTIEEREEYEPHLRDGNVVFAGVDYQAILRRAEAEADVILWDGGNNDLPFYWPDLHLVVADPHRPGHELAYHPGEANFRMADVIVIGKTDSARQADVLLVEENARKANPRAKVVLGALAMTAEEPERLRGKRAVVVEDGPTVTHGGMGFGAGSLVAQQHGATLVDAATHAVGSIAQAYRDHPHLRRILPAMGYGAQQVKDLEATIRASGAEVVVDGSPVDLARLIDVEQPIVNVRYEYRDLDHRLRNLLDAFLREVDAAANPGPR